MKKKFKQIKLWIKAKTDAVTPGKTAVKGAALGILTVTAILWLLFASRLFRELDDVWVLAISLLLMLASTLAGFLAHDALKLLLKIPRIYKLALLISMPLLVIMGSHWSMPIVMIIISSLVGAGTAVLIRTGFKNLTIAKKLITMIGFVIGIAGLVALSYLFAVRGFQMEPVENAAQMADQLPSPIPTVSPVKAGDFNVLTLTYGSGKDLHRPEYGEKVDIITDSVNGVAFIDNWSGLSGWWRERYWGFDAHSLPINGRVWYPEGDGPFPLVLVVHGNHGMQDFSDPGYDYLGELLASRGIILASVDENFINGSWSDIFGSLKEENDARGWLMLEHLREWHDWNRTENHLFYRKIDTTRIGLIGHSRGGEAVAHAALFNTLPYYPDDASIKFDYGYQIQAVMAIAPVDGQYEPGDTRTALENVSYFVIQGSQDADLRSFMGSQQYERVAFTDSAYHFKSALYVYGANHGQFNTTWGDNDASFQWTGYLNLEQLMPEKEQQEIAKVFTSAFLDVTLRDKHEYLPLFLDTRTGRDWLPETVYLSQFEDATFEPLVTFQEDLDITTLSTPLGKISSKNLTVWREQEIKLKWQEKGSRAAFIGWHYPKRDSTESIPDSLVASYTITLPTLTLDTTAALTFALAESKESTDPKSGGKWVNENAIDVEHVYLEEREEDKADSEKSAEKEIKETKPPIDFTIELTDTTGQTISFPLSMFSPLQREIEVTIRKTQFITGETESEKVFQTFYFPLKSLTERNSAFDLSKVKRLRFIFDKSDRGVIVLDNLGIMASL